MCLSANESFSQAEKDLLLLTGMKVGHSTLQRQVDTNTDREHLEFPDSSIAVDEVCLDGGKVRLRTKTPGQKCEWRENPRSEIVRSILWGNISSKRRGERRD